MTWNRKIFISVIIPIGPGETKWEKLVSDLGDLPFNSEIILVFCNTNDDDRSIVTTSQLDRITKGTIVMTSPAGRAIQQNSGADAAKGEYLWFLHADSRVSTRNIKFLQKSIRRNPDRLHYFDLLFKKTSCNLIILNELGAKIRSDLMKLPFGDQGFCIKRELFHKIGGFPEGDEYGEDHLFVWGARREGVKLNNCGTKLLTSSRKYKEKGWCKVTILHQRLWLRQAVSEWIKYIRNK